MNGTWKFNFLQWRPQFISHLSHIVRNTPGNSFSLNFGITKRKNHFQEFSVKYSILLSLALTACGGGSGSPAPKVPSSSDRDAPVVLAQALARDQDQALITKDAQGLPQISLSVTASSDNIDVTAHCLTETATAPRANSGCFSEAKSWNVRIGPGWRAWARDAAGNVSVGSLSPGPCSDDAYAASAASSLPTVCVMTDQGEIVLELESTKAPNTVQNFLSYVREGFYSGTVFHRVLPGSVLQGGGFSSLADVPSNQSKSADRDPIDLEKTSATGLSNTAATIAMARTTEPNTATSQFFINLQDNSGVFDSTSGRDGYAVFGRVIHGFDTVVLPIANVPLGGSNNDLSQ
jgi:peptidyl-prolyl cis-trans isomerase A (cyclophilin A)